MSDVDFKRLTEIIDYNPETGKFTWLINPCKNIKAGTEAGCVSDYRYITINKKRYGAHRLAWLYFYKQMPTMQIDHKNGNKLDNRIENLRLATPMQNGQNRHKAQKNNAHGKLGLNYDKTKKLWRARIGIDNKRIYLGKFKTQEAAYEAYLAAKRELHSYGNL
jgi:hypothetical protein